MKQIKKKEIRILDNDSTETTYFYDLGTIIEVTSENEEKGQYDIYPDADENEWLEADTLPEARKLLEGFEEELAEKMVQKGIKRLYKGFNRSKNKGSDYDN